jgi:DNA-directed RNA polymerase specialized sigma subunit
MGSVEKEQVSSSNMEQLRDAICSTCPGTLWGSKSICRVFQKHISEINHCEEWAKRRASEIKVDHLEPALEILQRVEEDLKDYHWMVREIERLQSRLKTTGQGITSIYGVESTLPKPTGKHNDPVSREAEHRVRQAERMMKLKEKVKRIEQAAEKIEDEKERTVLECILDGVRMGMIAHHVGLSRQKVYEIKREILKRMAWELYGEELKGA